MNLIVETDIGHDPDDLFALCYLIAAGVNIKAVLVHPGDPDQIAVARVVRKFFGLNFPIGFDKENRTKNSSGRLHHWLCKEYGESLDGKADGPSMDVLMNTQPECGDEFFIMGPVTTVGNYLEKSGEPVNRATMQGGFISYDLCPNPGLKLSKFIGKTSMPTFNLNGDRSAGEKFLAANVKERRMVGKNLCHKMVFKKEDWTNKYSKAYLGYKIPSLFWDAAYYYFNVLNNNEKIFHDPTAAVLHLHPEIAEWVRGRTVKMADGWGTILDPEGDYIASGIIQEKMWDHLFNFN